MCPARKLCAIENRVASLGEVFNTVSTHALTLRGYAEAMFRWFDHEPRLSYQPFGEWMRCLSDSDAHTSRGHDMRSSCVSIEKSQMRLGYPSPIQQSASDTGIGRGTHGFGKGNR